MNVLFVSNLFPDAGDPLRGQINATALHHLARLCTVRVLALRPVLPLMGGSVRSLRPRLADAALDPEFVPVRYLPKIGGRVNPGLCARSVRGPIRELRRRFPFDVVLCAWLYPDGAGLAQIQGELGAPLVHIVQGSDVHEYIKMPARRPFILDAAERADAVITRSRALEDILRAAGVRQPRIRVIYNGVDTGFFKPGDRAAARRELGLPADARVILYVGDFLAIKNPLLAVRAHGELCRRAGAAVPLLVMIGAGRLADEAAREASSLGSASQLRLAGSKTRAEVARHMQAADVLCIPSENEGVPNVMLEAFASGLPVAATRVGGIPELLTGDFLGRLTPRGDATAMARALEEVLAKPAGPDVIARHAQRFSWEDTAKSYHALLSEVVGLGGTGQKPGAAKPQ